MVPYVLHPANRVSVGMRWGSWPFLEVEAILGL